MNAQEDESRLIIIEKGDTIKIVKPSANIYKSIKFPNAHFIFKKRDDANYKTSSNETVFVFGIKTNKNGVSKLKITREDVKKLFYNEAIEFKDALNTREVNYK